jgi:hypothetical protein
MSFSLLFLSLSDPSEKLREKKKKEGFEQKRGKTFNNTTRKTNQSNRESSDYA